MAAPIRIAALHCPISRFIDGAALAVAVTVQRERYWWLICLPVGGLLVVTSGETPAVSDLVPAEARTVMRSLAEEAFDRVAKQLVVSHKSLRALEKRMEKDR